MSLIVIPYWTKFNVLEEIRSRHNDHRIRVSSDAPPIASAAASRLVATVTDVFWSSFTPTPARALGTAAGLLVRQKRSAEAAARNQAAKEARLDGSANRALAGDGSDVLTSRVEFSHARFRTKTTQPIEVTAKLCGGLMAKLMVHTEAGVRTEEWSVGRLKSAKPVRVAMPQGGATVVALLFVWQALDSAGRASGDLLCDLSLDVMSCGPTREWVMVEPQRIGLNSTRGRSRGRGRRSGGKGRAQGRGGGA